MKVHNCSCLGLLALWSFAIIAWRPNRYGSDFGFPKFDAKKSGKNHHFQSSKEILGMRTNPVLFLCKSDSWKMLRHVVLQVFSIPWMIHLVWQVFLLGCLPSKRSFDGEGLQRWSWTWLEKPSKTLYGGFHKWGYRNSWRVYKGKSHLEMDENWGYPYDSGNLYLQAWAPHELEQYLRKIP